MDPQEKQELKKNDLESFLYYRLPHYLKQYGAYILLVFALLFLGWQLWRRHEAKEQSHIDEASARLTEAKNIASRAFQRSVAGTPENPVTSLNDVLNDFKDVKPVAAEAHLALANFYNTMVVTNKRDVAGNELSQEEAIKRARAEFETVISEFAEYPTRVAAAKLGLASLCESENKFDEAKKLYEELSADGSPWAGSAYASEAKRKLKLQVVLKDKVRFVEDPPERTNGALSPSSGFFPGTNVPLVPLIGPGTGVEVLPKFSNENTQVLPGLRVTPEEKPVTLPGIGGDIVPSTQPAKP